MRNAVKRVTHKERAQPKSRKKFGLLEKHKDYIERANDFKKKKTVIKNLKKKAADRNPDEFYFNMHNSQVTDGVHKIKRDGRLSGPTLQLLKTQDMGYMIHRKCIDDRKAEKLRENLHLIGEGVTRKHKVFVENTSELDSFDVSKHFDTAPELVGRFFNRPKTETIEKIIQSSDAVTTTAAQMLKVEGKRKQAYKELKSRTSRSAKLMTVINGLALQRNLMGKGTRKKVALKDTSGLKDVDDTEHASGWKRKGDFEAPTVYKWNRDRKR